MELTGTNRPKAYFFEMFVCCLRSLYGFWIITLGFLWEVEAFYSEILNNEVIR